MAEIKHVWAEKKFVDFFDDEKGSLKKTCEINKLNYLGREGIIDSLINPKQGDVILDIGCGEGDRLKKYSDQCMVIGIDISFKMCQKARENLTKGETLVASMEALPFKANTINKIVAIYSIIYSFNKPTVFREISRALKQRGELIIYEPNRYSFLTLLRYLQTMKFYLLRQKSPKVIHHRIVTNQSMDYSSFKKLGAMNNLQIHYWRGQFYIQMPLLSIFNRVKIYDSSAILINLLNRLNYDNWGKTAILKFFADFIIIKFLKGGVKLWKQN